MSLFGISDTQLEQLSYPNGRGSFYYGNQPLALPAAQSVPVTPMAAPGAAPVTAPAAVPAPAAPAAPLAAAAPAAGGIPGGGGMGGYASIASGAIDQIAKVAGNYVAAKANAEALKNQSAIPNIPESGGALAGFQAPSIRIG